MRLFAAHGRATFGSRCQRTILVALAALAPCAALTAQRAPRAAAPARRAIAIVHATLLTLDDSLPLRDGTVVISKGRITAVGPARSTRVPRGARIIDGRGHFVIPGLWDMHVHAAVPLGEPLLQLYVANGVTGVRDMGGDFATIQQWQQRIARGELVGPRIIASGPYIQGGDAALPHFDVRTPAQATAAVDSLATLGVDFVKIHEMVPRDAYFALARAARRHGLPLAGHLITGVSTVEAADSGQRSLEHLKGFPNPCTMQDSLRLSTAYPLHYSELGECSTADQRNIYRHIASRETWVTPTLVALEMLAALPGERLPSDSLGHYLPGPLKAAMSAALEIPSDMPADANVLGRALWRKRLETVRDLRAGGVPILVGTDAPLPNSIPGFGMSAELEALVLSGMTPWQALRAATVEAGRYFGKTTIGRLCVGCNADVVILSANPIEDIRNVRRIRAVVADGRMYTSERRQALRERALEAAASH